jgi:glucuronoarabinoxylan endo-1,4-beta-xylanase
MYKTKTVFSLLFILLAVPSLFAQSVTVTWTATYQSMDGWGASTGYFASNVNTNSSQADLFFSPTAGIGLEYVRTSNTPDGSMPDLPTLQLATARGAKVILSMYGPPASMMSNGTFASQSGYLLPADYGAFANYIVNWIQTLQANGVHVDVFSPANEPNTQANWTAATLDTFISQNLGPAFAAAGLTTTITIAEYSDWFTTDLVSTCLNDMNCAKYVTIAAGHGYGAGTVDGTGVSYCCTTATTPPSSVGSRRVWMTEINGGFTKETSNDKNMWVYDPSMADAMVWAHNIHDFLTVGNASAWMYWNLASYSATEYNDGLTDYNFNPAKRFYVVGNWSKFVRNGWTRIGATASPATGIYITAFKEMSSGNFAIVAVNQNSSAVHVDFSLSGFPSVTSVTPTLTSASVDLVDQLNANVSGQAFSYSLPATSVVTFHGTASSSSSGKPDPPTNLTLTVH